MGGGAKGLREGRHMTGAEDNLPGRLSQWAEHERRQTHVDAEYNIHWMKATCVIFKENNCGL